MHKKFNKQSTACDDQLASPEVREGNVVEIVSGMSGNVQREMVLGNLCEGMSAEVQKECPERVGVAVWLTDRQTDTHARTHTHTHTQTLTGYTISSAS